MVNGKKFDFGRISILIPSFNEAAAIGDVVADFKRELPDATIYVYDNNSSDNTAAIADEAGAIVRMEPFQGKGNVVRRMFADVEADTYVMVDGDGTYDAPSVAALLQAYAENGVDMVNGARVTRDQRAYRPGHRFGNWLLTSLVASIFGWRFKDMLSGYRVFSRRFVKSFPSLSSGFEIETELTVHALELRMATCEIDTPYHARPEGSESKLNTFRDGWRILLMIVKLVKEERPLPFFSAIFAVLVLAAIVLAVPIVITYMETGLVPRFPTAILATGIMILAFLSLASGMILDTVTRGRQEMKRMRYLAEPGPFPMSDKGITKTNE
ncbi:glycosyltransferase [Magnetospira sp. QH-2]|uniref:glycosyltransferase n=1 Tax=Magnetospira sp. (strain QH-2) TaxID=1288970 RepID=UPI0003E812BC|nr:glycosyltransferase [Magnetospira sp. QH-2]CCQ75237.1 Putative GT2 : distantly related to GDP-Man: Dol-P b-mannosyltransferase [Magnetospira sp. QH-2]